MRETTSFAYVARLELTRALRAHPMGPFLFAVTACLLMLGVQGALRGGSLAANHAAADDGEKRLLGAGAVHSVS